MTSEQNLTAEERIQKYGIINSDEDVAILMRKYAIQVAEQVRRECADQFIDDGNIGSMYRESILNVEIKTP